jgi:hypothetical protein
MEDHLLEEQGGERLHRLKNSSSMLLPMHCRQRKVPRVGGVISKHSARFLLEVSASSLNLARGQETYRLL